MRICNRCKSAENPRGSLSFVDSPEGVLCGNCYSKLYSSSVPEELSAASDFSVVSCPDCRGRHHASHGVPCKSCRGYGVVRLAVDAIPVFPRFKEKIDE